MGGWREGGLGERAAAWRAWLRRGASIDVKVGSSIGAENLAADHSSRLENPDLGTFTEEEITNEFPDEHLMILKVELNNDEPWNEMPQNNVQGLSNASSCLPTMSSSAHVVIRFSGRMYSARCRVWRGALLTSGERGAAGRVVLFSGLKCRGNSSVAVRRRLHSIEWRGYRSPYIRRMLMFLDVIQFFDFAYCTLKRRPFICPNDSFFSGNTAYSCTDTPLSTSES
ncbi:hypothetical protein Tco_0368923 [Tanacetum coccineum]